MKSTGVDAYSKPEKWTKTEFQDSERTRYGQKYRGDGIFYIWNETETGKQYRLNCDINYYEDAHTARLNYNYELKLICRYDRVVETTHSSPIRPVLSKVYYILRNVVLVLFMSVLVYTGIKMVLSSTSNQDKAKYKIMLKDWFIGLLLLFTLHFIMIGISILSTKLFGVFSWLTISANGIDILFSGIRNAISYTSSVEKIGYVIMYLVMIIYTIMFTFQYIKRVIYVAFLTLVAPFVALTYPIDKMKDGKAQAFNMWFKEYIYNVLIQIVHMILYYVLVEMAIELVSKNIIYALVAIGFLLQAEKLLKTMFGLQAQGGMFGGKPPSALAGALTMQAVHAIGRKLGKGGGPGKSGEKGNKESDNNKIRTADSGKSINSLLEENDDNTDSSDHNEDNNNPLNLNTRQQEENENQQTNAGARGINNLNEGNDYQSEQSNTETSLKDKAFSRIGKMYNGTRNFIHKDRPRLRGVAKTAGHYTGKLLKVGAKAAIGAGVGMVGVAAGLASDDFENVFKYGAAGAGVGYVLGGKVLETPSGIKRAVGGVKDTYRSYAHPGDNSYKNNELDKKWLKDEDSTRLYAAKLNVSMSKARELKEQYAQKYREYGVTDDKTIIRAMKLDASKYGNQASNERIAAAALAQRTKTSKELKDLIDSFEKRAKNNNEKARFKNITDAIQNMNDIP